MKSSLIQSILGLMVIVILSGCSPGIDKKKFEAAQKAAHAVQDSIDNMDDYEKFGKVFNAFSDEVITLRERVKGEKEEQLLSAYTELLLTYQDGYQLWEYKVESSRYSWIPEEKIYLEPKVKALALKYHLPVESHVIELTNHPWKSVPADSLKIIWERARSQFGKIRP
jgi:hypothetical protein